MYYFYIKYQCVCVVTCDDFGKNEIWLPDINVPSSVKEQKIYSGNLQFLL